MAKAEDYVEPVGADMQTRKFTQEQVRYRRSDGDEACGKCIHFLSPDACQKVQGRIAANGVCDEFEDETMPMEGGPSLEAMLFGGGM